MSLPIEIELKLIELREKVESTNNPSEYSKEEMTLLKAAYHDVTGYYAPENCAACTIVFTIIRNWYKKYDKRTIEPTIVELKPVEDSNKTITFDINEENPNGVLTSLPIKTGAPEAIEEVTNTLSKLNEEARKEDVKAQLDKLGIKYRSNISHKSLIKKLAEATK